MSFLIKVDELLKKYNEISENVKSSIEKEINSEPVCKGEYLKAKIKSINGKINKNFHNNKILKKGFQLFVYQSIWWILFLEQVKVIVLKCL